MSSFHDNRDNNDSLDLLTSASRGANNRGVEYAASLILMKTFCKIEVRHTLKRKKSFFVFPFQTVSYCILRS